MSRVVAALAVCALWAMPAPGAPSQDAGAAPEEIRIPDEERARPNPRPAVAQSIENGRLLFASQCAMCHGEKGDGRGSLAVRLRMEVPDYTDPRVLRGRTDGEIFFILTHGCRRMPGEGERLKSESRWDLVNYLRSLGRP